MRIIEQLVYKIQGDNSEFDKSITQSETKVSKFGSVAEKMLAGVTVTAIAMTVKKLGEMAIASATALDRVDKMSQKIGLSREAFQEWDYVLGQSGASVEGLQMGLKTLSSAADEAQKGTLQYKESFDRLGVSVTDVNGNMKDQETLFNEVFFALADMENQTERTAIAADLLGRSATELSPALNTSAEDLEALRVQAHELGLVYEDDLIDAGVILGDNIDALTKSFNALKTRALAPIIGVMVTVTDKILGHKKQISELETETKDLNTQSEEYKRIMGELLDPTRNLTDAERVRLEILRDIQAQNVADTTNKVATAFKKTKKDIEENNAKLNELIITEQAYTSVMLDISTAQARYNELYENKNRTDEEQIEFMKLGQALLDTEAQRRTVLFSLEGKIDTQRRESIALNDGLNTSMQSIISSVADGIISVDQYALTNKEFYDTVMNGVRILEDERKAIKERARATKDFNALTFESEEALEEYIKKIEGSIGAQGTDIYTIQLLTLAKAKLAEMTGTVTEAIRDATDALDEFNRRTKERADAIKEMAQTRMSDHEKAIAEIHEQAEEWLRAGVNRTEVATWVSEQIQKLIDEESAKKQAEKDAEAKRQEEETAKLEQEEANRKKIREDAYAEIERSRMDEYQLALDNIEKQTQAYITAGVSEVDAEKWKTEQIAILDKELADEKQKLADEELARLEEEAERAKQAWVNIASQGLGLISDMIESFSAKTISKIGSTIKAVGQTTGDATTMAVGMVLELGGQVISFFDDMEERAEIWAQNMQNLSYEVMQTQLANTKATLDQEYQIQKDALDEQENLRITALLNTISEEEQAELKSRGFIEETKMEQLERTAQEEYESSKKKISNLSKQLKKETDLERIAELERSIREEQEAQRSTQIAYDQAIKIQEIRDEFATNREDAEKEYRQKVAQYEYDKAVLDKQIAVANANISMNKAIADLGWFNWNKKDEVRGLYADLIGAIESTPLPPIPSFNVGSIRIPEDTPAVVHRNEMILPAPMAEQARQEGISITPSGGGNTTFMIYLDGKKIAENTVGHVNSGVYRIDARVVK